VLGIANHSETGDQGHKLRKLRTVLDRAETAE